MPSDNDLFQLRGLHRHADDMLEKVGVWRKGMEELVESWKELEKSFRVLAESSQELRKVMGRADDRLAVAGVADRLGGKR